MSLTPQNVLDWKLDQLSAAKGTVDEYVQGMDTVLPVDVDRHGCGPGLGRNAHAAATRRVNARRPRRAP